MPEVRFVEDDSWRSFYMINQLLSSPARFVVHVLMVWRWRARLRCHGNVWCCQYQDRANCNNLGAPKGLHHR